MTWHRTDECGRRLARIPGVGPIGASMLVMKTPAPQEFRSARHFAAWLGLTPKDHSTAGKVRPGVITRAGDEALRSVLVTGATAVIKQAQRGRVASPWLVDLLNRKTAKLAAVALANKIARVAWKLVVRTCREITASRRLLVGCDGVVPFAVKFVAADVDCLDLLVGDLEALWIEIAVDLATNLEACLGGG